VIQQNDESQVYVVEEGTATVLVRQSVTSDASKLVAHKKIFYEELENMTKPSLTLPRRL
jgi:hypothetical protein